ncbi:MAG: hypothetical protein ABIS18_08495 [Actinomycetota bacterium]
MTKTTAYRNRYPLSGEVAVLCEGDLVGYEAALLERWIAQEPTFSVDVWPCGTKTALYGVSDAIGRSRPIVVIEDRDFRTTEEADRDCNAKAQDRAKREVAVKTWMAWNRNEIENYLIEPEVLTPVLAEYFSISTDLAYDRLGALIPILRGDQAAQWALYNFRSNLSTVTLGGLPRSTHRPAWSDTTKTFLSPALAAVESQLQILEQEATSAATPRDSPAPSLVELFRAKNSEWASVSASDSVWKTEWCGKDLLVTIEHQFSGEFGWASQPVRWDQLKRAEAGKLGREIEWELQPALVASFLSWLASDQGGLVSKDWVQLRDVIRGAATVTGADLETSVDSSSQF